MKGVIVWERGGKRGLTKINLDKRTKVDSIHYVTNAGKKGEGRTASSRGRHTMKEIIKINCPVAKSKKIHIKKVLNKDKIRISEKPWIC